MFGFLRGGGGESSKPKEPSALDVLPPQLQHRLDDAAAQLHGALPASVRDAAAETSQRAEQAGRQFLASPLSTAVLSAAVTAGSLAVYWRYFRRIRTADHITPGTLRWRKTLVGRCTSVGDADGFRMYHQMPFPFRLLSPVPRPAKSTETLSVRLAGADAPESAHFGKEAQPFSKEARAELVRLCLDRTVWCKVAHVDQYKRLVATPYVWLPPYILGRTNVSHRLVWLGLATVYTQSGAAYAEASWLRRRLMRGDKATWGLRSLQKAQDKAKRAKRGMWSLGDKLESPADFKRRTKAERAG